MSKLAKLQQRKTELKYEIERQREDLKKTFQEVRAEIEPANLLKNAVSGLLGFSKGKDGGGGKLSGLLGPVALVADLLIKDPKVSLLVKLLAPAAMKFLPKIKKSETEEEPEKSEIETAEKPPKPSLKAKFYGRLRKGISVLRRHLGKEKLEIGK